MFNSESTIDARGWKCARDLGSSMVGILQHLIICSFLQYYFTNITGCWRRKQFLSCENVVGQIRSGSKGLGFDGVCRQLISGASSNGLTRVSPTG